MLTQSGAGSYFVVAFGVVVVSSWSSNGPDLLEIGQAVGECGHVGTFKVRGPEGFLAKIRVEPSPDGEGLFLVEPL